MLEEPDTDRSGLYENPTARGDVGSILPSIDFPENPDIVEFGGAQGMFAASPPVAELNPSSYKIVDPVAPPGGVSDLISTYRGTAEDYLHSRPDPLPLGAVFMLDALEHMSEPMRVLRWCRKALAETGGPLLLSLPNVSSTHVLRDILIGSWHYHDQGVLDRTHRWFFTPATASEAVAEAGFNVEKIYSLSVVDVDIFKRYSRPDRDPMEIVYGFRAEFPKEEVSILMDGLSNSQISSMAMVQFAILARPS